MKLLHKITGTYLLASAVVLAFSSLLLYFLLQWQVEKEIDEELTLQEEMIAGQIEAGSMPHFPLTEIRQLSAVTAYSRTFGDSVIFDQVQQEDEDYRYLRSVQHINGKDYAILVMDAHVGWGDYYVTIFLVFLLMGLLLGLSGVVVNYFIAKSVWKPFFQNLTAFRGHAISSPEPLDLQPSDVVEFRQLRDALLEQTRRSRREYVALREFTENASHEIQTPLAILQAKLDRLSQYPLQEEMAHHLALAKSSASRLSRINKDLLLLAKLENSAFDERETVDIRALVQAQLAQMEELFALKGLHLQVHTASCVQQANRYLVDILLSNLLSNALRHTPEQGRVIISQTADNLMISNTGAALTMPEEQLFERFKKERMGSEQSTGLGLAIANEICKAHGWRLQYKYEQGEHWFGVQFTAS